MIAAAVLAVRLLSAERILSWAARPPYPIRRFADPDLPAYVAAAVQDRATWFNLAAPCLPTALAALWMLRRRGIRSTLCLGVRRETSALKAHAWLEIDGKVSFGASEQPYAPIARYGT